MLQHIWATSRICVDHVGTCCMGVSHVCLAVIQVCLAVCVCAYACVLFRKVLRSRHQWNVHPDWSLVQLLYSVTLLLTGSSLTTTPKIFSMPLWLFWHATLPGTWLIHVAIRYCRFCMAMSLVNQPMSGRAPTLSRWRRCCRLCKRLDYVHCELVTASVLLEVVFNTAKFVFEKFCIFKRCLTDCL